MHPFALIHLDIWGPYHARNHDWARFFLTIVDDFSRGTWVFLMQTNDQTLSHLRNFFSMVTTQFKTTVQFVRSDNAMDFFNHNCSSLFSSLGILHESSCTYTPQQNEVVERKHRHLLEIARALKHQVNIPTMFWGECVITSTYLINRMPTRVLGGKTPYELLFGKIPDINHLIVFGCLCFSKVLHTHDKFGKRAIPCIFFGYPMLQKGYRLYDLESKKFFCFERCSIP